MASDAVVQIIKDVFDEFDKDKSGSLSPDELVKGLESAGLPAADIEKAKKFADANKDGQVSFQEFIDWWNSA